MLLTPHGKRITQVPHTDDFKKAVRLLGDHRAEGVRREVNRIIDELAPDKKSGRRTFSPSHVGKQLKPWPYPLASLYDVALEIEGKTAMGRQVHDRAVHIFGLFIWETIMAREERWVVHDYDANQNDSDQAMTDTVYTEQGLDETITRHP